MKLLSTYKIYNTLILSLLILFFAGCVPKEVELPQTLETFLSQAKPIVNQEKFANEYIKNYYMPWNGFSYDQNSSAWAINIYKNNTNIYLSNKKVASEKFWQNIEENANYKDFKILNAKAMAIKPTYIKNIPTDEPLFRDFSKAGEGYPFDYNQNSYTKLNEPLIISHFSKDKEWALAQNHFTVGWIKSDSFAFIKDDDIKDEIFIVNTKDNLAVYDTDGNFIAHAKLGTLFPLLDENTQTYKVKAGDKISYIDKENGSKFPIDFDEANIQTVASELLDEDYGWGGLLFKRDCSLMTKDFFAPFGIWLPRNSFAQSKRYEYIDISKLKDDEKEKKLLEVGVPFETLIYLPGHIMLYLGNFGGKAYAMHNTWGVKTKNNAEEGRYIIAKSIISTLKLGLDIPNHNPDGLIIKRAKGIVIIK